MESNFFKKFKVIASLPPYFTHISDFIYIYIYMYIHIYIYTYIYIYIYKRSKTVTILVSVIKMPFKKILC